MVSVTAPVRLSPSKGFMRHVLPTEEERTTMWVVDKCTLQEKVSSIKMHGQEEGSNPPRAKTLTFGQNIDTFNVLYCTLLYCVIL